MFTPTTSGRVTFVMYVAFMIILGKIRGRTKWAYLVAPNGIRVREKGTHKGPA
jgi:hypothetical protein